MKKLILLLCWCSMVFGQTTGVFKFTNAARLNQITDDLKIANAKVFTVANDGVFVIAHGSAPVSPVNGQIWTTTAGVFVRVNGVTVGPLGTGGGGGGGSGTVTDLSVGNLSPLFTASVATSTSTPAVTFTLVNQSANVVYAGPTSGGAAAPTFRALVAADIPTLTLAKISDDGALAALNTVGTSQIDNSAVTYAKVQNVSATSRVLGRITAGAGVVEELTAANLKTILALTSSDVGLGSVTNDAQTKAVVFPNTLPAAGQIPIGNAGGTAYAPQTVSSDATIASTGALTIANAAVTYAKMQNVSAASKLLGRGSSGSGSPQEITLGSGLSMTGTTLAVTSGGTGTVTDFSAGDLAPLFTTSEATTTTTPALTFTLSTQVANRVFAGPSTGADAVPTFRALVANDIPSLTLSKISDAGALAALATVGTSQIDNDAVTFAKIQNITTDRLVGRDTAGTGDPEELTVSGGLEFTGSGGIQTSALTGDVTKTAGGTVTVLANIPTGTPAAGSVLYTAIAAPSTPASGKGSVYVDSTSKNLAVKNDAGVVNHGVRTKAAVSNSFVTAIDDDGTVTVAQPSVSNLSGLGTGVGTFLGTPSGANLASALTSAIPTSKGGTGATSYVGEIGLGVDGAGVVITTGEKVGARIQVPFACTITKATLIGEPSGSAVVDVWKDTNANYPPTNADSIVASAKPTLSSATKATDSTLTGWTTSVAAGDWIFLEVESCSTITALKLLLEYTR